MDTLLLDLDNWDLVVDAAGNIAVASEPYSIAQDVASACRLFLGELYYQPDKGIPYFQQILAQNPPASLIKAQVEKAAMTVPEVASATCVLTGEDGRTLTGQIQVVDTFGDTTVVNLI